MKWKPMLGGVLSALCLGGSAASILLVGAALLLQLNS